MAVDVARPARPIRRAVARGLSLLELLVVVAVIALLICILLPSLQRARAQARAVVCAANLGSTCRAENVYQSENQDWIPGSAWTTGYWFLTSPDGAKWDVSLPGFNRFAVNMWDYVTPLRAGTLGRQAISTHRSDLIVNMTGTIYSCPSSNEEAFKYGEGQGPAKIKAVSQMTMMSILTAGPAKYEEVRRNLASYPGITKAGWVAQYKGFSVAAPPGYMPRHSRLGREQLKVFVADGLRYFDENTRVITYSSLTNRDAKLMSCATPPSTGGTAFQYGREYNLAREFSYRHGHRDRIQAGFFDGHAEGLSLGADRDPSHFTGKAVHPQYYYPSGSVVNIPGELHLDDIPKGTILP